MLTHSPSAILFSKIKAELVANGTPFADAAAEAAFRTWFQTAWADSGYTSDFTVLYQPDTSTEFSVGVRVGTSGHKVNVWWGDGTSNSYTPSTNSNTTVSKTYGSLAKRPIVVLGRITRWEGESQAYGGRLWENLRSLTYLSCYYCPLLTGSISSLPSGLTYLDCGGCPLLTGSISSLPSGLTFLSCNSCSLLTGSISSLPSGLTVLSCYSCPLLTGSISSLPSGLTYLSCNSCSLLTGSISSLPSGLTYLDCGGCPLLTGSISSLPSGLTYLSCNSCSLLTGSISSLPSGLTYLDCGGVVTYTAGRTWASSMRQTRHRPASAGQFTSAMVDALLNDLANVTTWTNEKLVELRGNCGAATAASATARATITARGASVLLN